MKDILRTLVMAKYFCDENSCGLCNEALQTAQKQVVLAQQTTNSSSTKLADDIECAKQWLLPQRPVTQVEVDACIKELDIVISQLRT